MKKTKLNLKLLYLLLTLVLSQACTTDESEILQEESSLKSLVDETSSKGGAGLDKVDMIISWNKLLLELDQDATGMRPCATSRSLAYIGLAAYESVVFNFDNYTSNTNRLEGFSINSSLISGREINDMVALNACYAKVIDHFIYNLPSSAKDDIDDLEEAYEDELRRTMSRRVYDDSRYWGAYVADVIIDYSKTDIEAEEQILEPQPTSYEPPVGEGFWTYRAEEERALFPYWGKVRTFVISSEETTSVPPPYAYSRSRRSNYYKEMREVYDVSTRAKRRNNEDLWIAEFWSDDVEGLMVSPPGRQIAIALQLIEQYDVDFEESMGMMLKLGFSLNDTAVSSWEDKYTHMVMRPDLYIHEYIDEDYQTNLYKFIFWPNPTFPGYPSGHAAFASAAAGIFIDSFGDSTYFVDRTHEGRDVFLGFPRSFNSFSEMAIENAYSRIPLGVHIRMDCDEGLRLGYEIADAINAFDLTSVNESSVDF